MKARPYRVDDFLHAYADIAPHVQRSPVFLAFLEALEKVQIGGLYLDTNSIHGGRESSAYTLTVGDDETHCDGMLQRTIAASFVPATWVDVQDSPFTDEPSLEEEILRIEFRMPIWTRYTLNTELKQEPEIPGILLRLQRLGQAYMWDVEITSAWPPYQGPHTPEDLEVQKDWDALIQKIRDEYLSHNRILDTERSRVWELVETILSQWP